MQMNYLNRQQDCRAINIAQFFCSIKLDQTDWQEWCDEAAKKAGDADDYEKVIENLLANHKELALASDEDIAQGLSGLFAQHQTATLKEH